MGWRGNGRRESAEDEHVEGGGDGCVDNVGKGGGARWVFCKKDFEIFGKSKKKSFILLQRANTLMLS